MIRSGMTQFGLRALFVVLTTLVSFGQDRPSKEAPHKAGTDPLGPGDHTRTLMMGEQKRTYLVHVPKDYDPKKPTPVVLALHGAAMNGPMMVWFSGLNTTADKSGFIVVYPSGTGTGPFLTWNAGGFKGKMAEGKADDVAFIGKLLDDLSTVIKVDEKRVNACGMSNGGMMCYRLAAELSNRIAAVAPVAVIVTDAVDAAVGVPLITPVDDEIARPAGNEPDVTAYDTEPVKLLSVNAVEAVIAEPTVPDTVCVAGLKDAATSRLAPATISKRLGVLVLASVTIPAVASEVRTVAMLAGLKLGNAVRAIAAAPVT